MGFSGALVRVYSTTSVTDAYLARGVLEAEGIPVILKGEAEGPYRMGPAHLWVPEELEVQAHLVMEDMREGEDRPDRGDLGVGDDADSPTLRPDPDP